MSLPKEIENLKFDEQELLKLSVEGDHGHEAAADFRIGFRYGFTRGKRALFTHLLESAGEFPAEEYAEKFNSCGIRGGKALTMARWAWDRAQAQAQAQVQALRHEMKMMVSKTQRIAELEATLAEKDAEVKNALFLRNTDSLNWERIMLEQKAQYQEQFEKLKKGLEIAREELKAIADGQSDFHPSIIASSALKELEGF